MGEPMIAIKCFVAGVTGVFLVMTLLQVTINLTSKTAKWIEKKYLKDTGQDQQT